MKTKILLYTLLTVALVFGFVLPASAAQSVTVKRGDSMWVIAKRYNVPFSEVLRLNSHFSNVNLIHAGDVVFIPGGSSGEGTASNSNRDSIPQGNASAIAGSVEAKERAVLSLVNKERKSRGLSELSLSSKLSDLAEMKSEDMALKNYFSHTSPTYGSPFEMLQAHGVSYRSAGENIAAGQRSAEEVMEAWMNSSGHRANILNPSFSQLGVGYYAGGAHRTYWTQIFTGN